MENETSTVQDLIVMTALNNMLKQEYFSICTINEVAKILKVHPRAEEHNMLQALHCVYYKDMPKEVYDALPVLISKCLSLINIHEFEYLKEKKVTIAMSPVRRFLKLLER